MTLANNDCTDNRYMTVKMFCTTHEAFTEGGIRHLILFEKSNGFYGVFPKLGRRRLIDVPKFFERIALNAQ